MKLSEHNNIEHEHFNRKIKTKHIQQFEWKIADLLENEFPQFNKVIARSNLHGISFTQNPEGIYLMRSFRAETFEDIEKNHRNHFNLIGISAFN